MKIKDQAGDKKYFTIVPNYILNHSSATDQALYLQMKRLVGDSEGVCFASEKYFKDKMKIGTKALKSSIQYLIDHKWIELEGEKEVQTAGGPQKIKTYLVKDIWKMNIEHYKGVSESVPLDDKGVSESNQRGVQKETKGVRFQATKKNIREEELREEELPANAGNEQAKKIIELFKGVRPSYELLFKRKHEWAAARRLVDIMPFEELEKIIRFLPRSNTMPYCPVVTSPAKLEEKLEDLRAFWIKEKQKSNKNQVIKIS
jgi:hypothetical protein